MTTPELVIDALTFGDIPRCAALERRMFADDSPWPAAAFRAELNAPYNTYFAARERLGADVIGYAGISTLGQPDAWECEIHTIAVDPDHRGRGVGRALLAAASRHAAEVLDARVLEMTVIAQRAELIAWYERCGYALTGERRPFPASDPRFGLPRRDDLVFVVLAKALA